MTSRPPIPSLYVDVSILVVPHGIASNGDMLLGLQLTPVPLGSGGAAKSDPVDLAAWPATMRDRLTRLVVHLGDLTPAGGATPTPPLAAIPSSTRWSDRAAAAADELWYQTFRDGVAANLLSALEKDKKGGQSFSAASGIVPLIDAGLLSTELLADFHKRIQVEAEHGGIAAKRLATQHDRLRKWSPPGSARDEVGTLIEEREHRLKAEKWQAALTSSLRLVASRADLTDLQREDFTVARARARHRALELDGRAVQGRAQVLDQLSVAAASGLDDALEELAMATRVLSSRVRAQSQSPEDTARRKLASIVTSPTVATFLAVNAELRVPKQVWEQSRGPLAGVSYGAVAVSFGDVPPDGQGWTAYVHGGVGGANFFGPCDEKEALAGKVVPEATIVGGMLRLRARDGNNARYRLDVTDTVNSTTRRMDFARQSLSALRSGKAPADNEPNPIGRGLTLVDTGMHAATSEAGARLRLLQDDPTNHVNFAADLLRGYAVMFAIPKQQTPSLKSRPAEWRTAMGRGVSFRSAGQIDRAFVTECVSPEREFGLVDSIPITQIVKDEDGKTKPAAVVAQEMFSWHGGSLTIAMPTEGRKVNVDIHVCEDLAVPRRYHVPQQPRAGQLDYRPPPLRDGVGYLVGLSASYIGGWTLKVADAATAHAEDRCGHVLGDTESRPFEFRRPDKIPAPVLLLPHDSRMVTARNERDLLGESFLDARRQERRHEDVGVPAASSSRMGSTSTAPSNRTSSAACATTNRQARSALASGFFGGRAAGASRSP